MIETKTSLPPVPAPSKSKKIARLIIWAIVLIVFVMAVSAVIKIKYPNLLKKKQLSVSVTETASKPSSLVGSGKKIQNNPEIEQSTLLSASKISFPAIASSENMAEGELPKNVSLFLRSDAADLTAARVRYENGQKGYQVSYAIPGKDLTGTYQNYFTLAINNGYASITGRRANGFAFEEFQQGTSKLRITELTESQGLAITIQTIE